ncbi:MAG: GTPase Era [Thermodesulfobacteriota bacterium]
MDEEQWLAEFVKPVRCGMIAIVGPPNAGKSTLMNSLLGQKISIVTPKPQTTRNRILGVVNDEKYQLILVDTPGLHKPRQPLNREMVRVALESLSDVDGVLYMIDCSKRMTEETEQQNLRSLTATLRTVQCPVFLALNKIDLIEKEKLLHFIELYGKAFDFQAVVPISALRCDGTERLLDELVAVLPMGPRFFPDDIPTDATERFLVAEIVREKVFLLTGSEVPYSSAVVIDSFKEEEARQMVTIHATIILERKSQKGIVIGKGGRKIKEIGSSARKDIERLLGLKVVLKLWVKIRKKWSEDGSFLKEIGF